MLKKRVLKRLLPLLFSFCFVFSGFLSVKSYAYTSYDFFPVNTVMGVQGLPISPSGFDQWDVSVSSGNIYKFSNKSSTISELLFYTDFNFPVDNNIYDYYFICSVYGSASNISSFTYFPTGANISYSSHSNTRVPYEKTDLTFYHTDTLSQKGFSCSFKFLPDNANSIYMINFAGSSGTVPANLKAEFAVVSIPKNTSDTTIQGIISSINNQTNQLSSDIGQAADDVQQSIEDQYSGDPEEEFSVEDVITQHNEKMGVLSFGSDVMLQFLDMFQSANVGTAELTLPGFNITVENVEYSVWPDYSFNFEQLNEWVPALMSVIRVMLPAFVWLMVLRYCIKVFEDNFLSK